MPVADFKMDGKGHPFSGLLALSEAVASIQVSASDPADQQLPFKQELLRQRRVQHDEELFARDDFRSPRVAVDRLELVESLFGKIETGPVDILVAWHPANRRFPRGTAAADAVEDPFEHAH